MQRHVFRFCPIHGVIGVDILETRCPVLGCTAVPYDGTATAPTDPIVSPQDPEEYRREQAKRREHNQ